MTDTVKLVGDVKYYEELPEQVFECKEHGEYSGRPIKWKIGTEKIIQPPCPMCEKETEEMIASIEKTAKDYDEAKQKEVRINSLKKMNIGEMFWNESFETFNAYTDELKHHLSICVQFANNHEGRMLVMLGNNGNGKDHLAASILKKIGGYMYSVFEVELLLKETYSGRTSELDLYVKLCNEAPLLVINEIGKHKSGEWETHFLSYIINKRYENLKPVILISNKHIKDDCPGCNDCLQNYIGNDVISRIIESGEILTFTGEDYRYKKREMRKSVNVA